MLLGTSRPRCRYALMDAMRPFSVRCSLPASITFETNDSFAGQVQSEDDSMDSFDYDIINPCTGPVYFEGVKPGDVLEIEIKSIRCKSPG